MINKIKKIFSNINVFKTFLKIITFLIYYQYPVSMMQCSGESQARECYDRLHGYQFGAI